jgi:hypothetical protein
MAMSAAIIRQCSKVFGQRCRRMGLALLIAVAGVGSAQAGTLTNVSFSPASNITGVTTTYTVSFTLASTVNNTRAFRIVQQVSTPAAGNTNFDNASLVSITGGTLVTNIALAVPGEIYFNITAGTASAGTVVTLVLSGIGNPTITAGNSYRMRVDNLSDNEVDAGIGPGNTYVPNPGPTLNNPISDQTNIEKQSGAYTAVANLNSHFTDGDGDPLSFSVFNVGNAAVATAAVVGNGLQITPQGFGSTTITVRASDNAEGTADDTFNINVIGFLQSTTVTPGSAFVGVTTPYTVVFRPETNIAIGDFLILSHATGGPDQTGSTLGSLSGTLTGTKTGGGALFTVIQITGGSANATALVTMVLNNIVNPASPSTGPQYLLEKTNGSAVQDQARVTGTTYGNPTPLIFQNGFETGVVTPEQFLQLMPRPKQYAAAVPSYDPARGAFVFLEHALALQDANARIDPLHVIDWMHDVLIGADASGDWDGDRTPNRDDDDAFGWAPAARRD